MSRDDLSQRELYVGREQSLIKHRILQKYLQRFAMIIGFKWDTITYVDCFSGPWNVFSDDLADSSFSIALNELLTAQANHGKRGKSIKLRCLFLEKDRQAYAKLKEFAANAQNALVETRNCELADAIADVVAFIRKGGSHSFPFIFIDPTGWTGFAMDKIAPLLKLDPGEVLINFMTGHINRFIESPDKVTQESFSRLFGDPSFQRSLQGLSKRDREDAIVTKYVENLARTGKFAFTSKAIVLHPERDRTHFHLVYATRNLKGIEVFKEAEEKAMDEMEHVRAEAHKRKTDRKKPQSELFEPEVLHQSRYFDELRDRYLKTAKEKVLQLLVERGRVSYDDAWATALREQLVWTSDLKDWIDDWKKEGCLIIEGMKSKQRVPKLGEGNSLVWIKK
ncbi:MAG: three-Cys-motif partner protein TcmP [Chloracidobacterium sp.]|nr:three-Cys-motif partner protein TcmP [Chloracidobacterium sp.]